MAQPTVQRVVVGVIGATVHIHPLLILLPIEVREAEAVAEVPVVV